MALALRGVVAALAQCEAAPVAMVASSQPYTTVEAPAAAVQFHSDAQRFPLQRCPLRVCGTARLYQAAAVERYFAMVQEERLTGNRDAYSSMLSQVQSKLCSLTSEATTIYQPHHDLPPAWASVELVPLPAPPASVTTGRGHCGLSVSLWDANHEVIASTRFGGTPRGEERALNAFDFIDLMRGNGGTLPQRDVDVVAESERLRGEHEPILVGPMEIVGAASWSQTVAFAVNGGGPAEAVGSRDPSTGMPSIALTGWAFDVALLRAVTRLVAATAHGYLPRPFDLGYECDSDGMWTPEMINSMQTPPLVLCARNTTLLPLDMTRPMKFVMATPRVWQRFSAAPWQTALGDPALKGERMLAVKYRLFQEGINCGGGTAAFTPWRLNNADRLV